MKKEREIKKDMQIERQETSIFDVLNSGIEFDRYIIEYDWEPVYLGFVFREREDVEHYVVEPFRVPEPTARERQDTETIYHHRLQNSICVGVVQTSEKEFLARRIEYFLNDLEEYTTSERNGRYALDKIFELGKRVAYLTRLGSEILSEELADRMLSVLKKNKLIPQDYELVVRKAPLRSGGRYKMKG